MNAGIKTSTEPLTLMRVCRYRLDALINEIRQRFVRCYPYFTRHRPAERLRPTRENFIQTLHYGFIEFNLKRAQGAFELLQRARSDNRSRNRRVLKHPGKGDVILRFAELLAE